LRASRKVAFPRRDRKVLARGGKPPNEISINGHCKASLSTDSLFRLPLSGNYKVLTEAAIHGKVDMLLGLKRMSSWEDSFLLDEVRP
jgi:hypothetical protein